MIKRFFESETVGNTGTPADKRLFPIGLDTALRRDLNLVYNDPTVERDHETTLNNVYDVADLGRFNTYSIPESEMSLLVKNRHLEKEPFPVMDPDVIDPLGWVSDNLARSGLYPANNGIPITKSTTKITAKEQALLTTLAMFRKHGKKDLGKNEKFQKIVWNFSMDGSKNCDPIDLMTPTSTGHMQPDVVVCPDCKHVIRRRSYCDNPRCSSHRCGDHYAKSKSEDFRGHADNLINMAKDSNVPAGAYHVIVSFPADLSAQWLQRADHYETLLRIVSDIMRGLRMSAWATITHTHRGQKKHDRDLHDTIKDLGLPVKSTTAQFDRDDTGYYWRIGPHFHNVGVSIMPYDMPFYKAYCKTLYSMSGILVKIIPHNDPAEAVRYALTHMGIGTKLKETEVTKSDGSVEIQTIPAKRTMPAIRYYGEFSPTKSQAIEDGGTILGASPCVRPGCDCGQPMHDLHGVPAIRSHKVKIYRHRPPRGCPDILGDELKKILDLRPEVDAYDNRGRPIKQRILTHDLLRRILANRDFYIPKSLIPRFMVDTYPEVPDEYPEDLAIPCKVSAEFDGPKIKIQPETEVSEISDKPTPSRGGQIYDTLELMDMLGAEISAESTRNIGLSPGVTT